MRTRTIDSPRRISRTALQAGSIENIDKPEGWTSFDVVNKLRQATGVKKVGHAGTLDPFATGVLLVCFAKATKQVSELMALDKEYVGMVELGIKTDSHDVTGKIVDRFEVPPLSVEQVEQALTKYRGEILQRPPMFSAIKQGGRRLYKIARAGKTVEVEPRPVIIYDLQMTRFESPLLEIRMVCSRGTYVRALARDLGDDLGCGAVLKSLRRTRIGNYRVEESFQVEQFIASLTI